MNSEQQRAILAMALFVAFSLAIAQRPSRAANGESQSTANRKVALATLPPLTASGGR